MWLYDILITFQIWTSSRDYDEPHANVAISATYILPNAFTLPIQAYVYKALGTLISENAALSAIPVKVDNDTWFFRLPEIDLSQTISFQKRTRDYPAEEKPDTELCELLLLPWPRERLQDSWTFFLKQFFQHKICPYRDPGLWTGPKSFKSFDIEIRQIVISETVSTALRKRCRQNQTTITSAIHTAVARSLLAHLPEEYTRLEAISAMSSRRWLKEEEGITDQSMGMDHYSSDSFPWEVTRTSCATIKQVLSREGKDTSVGLLKYVDMWSYIQSEMGKDRDVSFKTSNLGVVKSVQEGESWPQIRRMMFTLQFDRPAAPLAVSSITEGDGCLVLGIIWQKGLAESEMFEGFVDGIATELHNAAK
ncbi:uncharacterized protein BO88DRAFT_441338 [Aspergillus vadensis CBS 113365]|uniref:Alcohol acetyltransferase n=1 Tax=Aspergillus vadensis (strain CBS 113365 / IMI 142717 / IBT 24658) TaxID=1448311 RepID=A0A319BI07_ASPVC|nr:hypothetical protein BO88DRAFT_441338 [Aspergillus vadensis CBS 113365]PYH72786.1 hypothetical protein BO88DRAFT_441338 [Aspergillus vadensis CBS 113365]